MDITIKETKHFEEADAIAKSSHDYFETGFEQLIKDVRSHILYGAFIGEKMVGFITYKIVSEGVVEISWLAVAPECRQKGIGTKLVTDTLKNLKTKYQMCEVKTLAETHPDLGYAKTRNFYKKLGFVSLEIIDPYPAWGKNNPCQIFVKAL